MLVMTNTSDGRNSALQLAIHWVANTAGWLLVFF